MRQNPKLSKDVAYLRQLCCSGLPKEIIVPELLRAMQTVIPSNNNVFSGFDEELNFAYFMLGFPLENVEETTTIVINFFNHERMVRTQAWLAHHPIIPDFRVYDEAFYQSDLYHSVFSQLDQHFVVAAPIVRFGKMLGVLNLFRARQQKPFNQQDEEYL
jgi:hypothetical protein